MDLDLIFLVISFPKLGNCSYETLSLIEQELEMFGRLNWLMHVVKRDARNEINSKEITEDSKKMNAMITREASGRNKLEKILLKARLYNTYTFNKIKREFSNFNLRSLPENSVKAYKDLFFRKMAKAFRKYLKSSEFEAEGFGDFTIPNAIFSMQKAGDFDQITRSVMIEYKDIELRGLKSFEAFKVASSQLKLLKRIGTKVEIYSFPPVIYRERQLKKFKVKITWRLSKKEKLKDPVMCKKGTEYAFYFNNRDWKLIKKYAMLRTVDTDISYGNCGINAVIMALIASKCDKLKLTATILAIKTTSATEIVGKYVLISLISKKSLTSSIAVEDFICAVVFLRHCIDIKLKEKNYAFSDHEFLAQFYNGLVSPQPASNSYEMLAEEEKSSFYGAYVKSLCTMLNNEEIGLLADLFGIEIHILSKLKTDFLRIDKYGEPAKGKTTISLFYNQAAKHYLALISNI